MSSFVPIPFDTVILNSARIMNYLGTQFASAKESIDIHIHDDLYYQKYIAQAKYSIPNVALLDADKIDGKHYNELIGGLIPIGLSFGWNGTDADVPGNFHIADGSIVNGIQLPDSRGNILMGAGSSHAARSSGGSSSLTTAGGTVAIAGHTLTLNEIPLHYHNWIDQYGPYVEVYLDSNDSAGFNQTPTVRAGTTYYNHDVADESHGSGSKIILLNPFSIVPLFFCKYLITKVS
jgi:hypothetical protein